MGDTDRRQAEAVASGPFSAGQIQKGDRHVKRGERSSGWSGLQPGAEPRSERPSGRRAWSHTQPSGSSGGSRKTSDGKTVKTESFDRNGDVRMDPVDGGYISSSDEDEEERMRRMNVEDLGVIDLTQEDDDRDSYAPVRVTRVQHVDRNFGVNAEGAADQDGRITTESNDATTKSKHRAGSSTAQGGRDEKHFQAVYSDSEMETEGTATTRTPRPKGKKKATVDKVESEPAPQTTDDIAVASPPSSPEARRKGKERIKSEAGSAPQPFGAAHDLLTQEDRDEDARIQDDLRIMREELGEVGAVGEDGGSKRDAKMYLFQMPPVLPQLVPIRIKPDPDAEDAIGGDVMQVDPPNNSEKPIKIEEDAEGKPAPPPPVPSGAVGKLRVHASGKVTMDWGGMGLCVEMGSRASFLQDVLLTELPETKVNEAGKVESGWAVGMGQVKGKFVVTPDWGELFARAEI